MTAASGQSDAKSGPALTNAAKPVAPDKSDAARQAAAGNPLWAIPIKTLAATRDRPLFSPTRRPAPPPVFALASAAPPLVRPPIAPERPPLRLIGIAAGKTDAIAVFLDQTTDRPVRLRSGQSQYGWVLGAVYKREVVLQKDEVIVHLPLSATAASAVAATPIAESGPERRQR